MQARFGWLHLAGSQPSAPAFVLGFAALLCWVVFYQIADLNEGFLRDLNITLIDPTGYITTARNLAERGELTANVLYPAWFAFPGLEKNYPYMPGYYVALAATYKLFGFGTFQSLLPSTASYLASSVVTFLIARRLYSARVAVLASLLFMLFPTSQIFSHTAFSEMTAVAATVVPFAVFLALSARLRLLVGPLLVALPVCFREFAAAVAVPMVLIILVQGRTLRWKHAALFAFLALVSAVAVVRSPLGSGRVPVSIFNSSFEALFSDALPHQSLQASGPDLVAAFGARFVANVDLLRRGPPPFTSGTQHDLELLTLFILISVVPAGVALGLCHRDPFFLGTAGLMAGLLASVLFAHVTPWQMHSVRFLMVGAPFAAIVWAWALHRVSMSLQLRSIRMGIVVLLIPVTILAMKSHTLTDQYFGNMQIYRRYLNEAILLMERVYHDDRYVIAAPFEISYGYLYVHYPVKWSYIPANKPTFDLLDQRYPVSTVVLPIGTQLKTVTADELLEAGFRIEGERTFWGRDYLVLQRRLSGSAIAPAL